MEKVSPLEAANGNRGYISGLSSRQKKPSDYTYWNEFTGDFISYGDLSGHKGKTAVLAALVDGVKA